MVEYIGDPSINLSPYKIPLIDGQREWVVPLLQALSDKEGTGLLDIHLNHSFTGAALIVQ